MQKKFFTEKGVSVVIEANPFAKGGEGAVHKVLSPVGLQGMCAKIYHLKQRDAKRHQKLVFMVANPPSPLVDKNHRICWPSQLLFNGQEFVGFLMPLAFDNSIELYELSTPKIRDKYGVQWQDVFDRKNKSGRLARLKLCTNLSIAIHHIHRLKNYVLVDLKPQNILVTIDGKISVTDCDSIQIAQNNRVLFPAKVATPEYTPPEGSKINPARQVIPYSWDLFSLSVIFYELLLGIHPYTASFSGKYKSMTALDDKIKQGLFVHGKRKYYVKVLPPLHNEFSKLPKKLRKLFQEALDTNKYAPNQRPTTEDWGKTLYEIVPKKKKRSKKVKVPVIPSPVPTTEYLIVEEGIGWWGVLYVLIPITGFAMAFIYSSKYQSKKSSQAHLSWIIGLILGILGQVLKH